ncbi:hypothetical protein R3W88_022600 [Solanum pinnatisectum]|uniref:Uncharacterized protein n=1 Tax=Solanum pinnatisectum TaxID=50273 RepID=A0AAV9LZ09_9SOLN|nr:hypothetical protein R3W88_022600 [Solanum pinnatisectum]
MVEECNFKIRDEEFKRRKELEIEKKQKEEQMQQGKDNKQTNTKEHGEKQSQNNKEKNNYKQPEQQQEQEWHVQKRRNNKQQEDKMQKIVWRPTSPQNRLTKEQQQHSQQQTGIANIPKYNSFTNLNMQERQNVEKEDLNHNRGTTPQEAQQGKIPEQNKTKDRRRVLRTTAMVRVLNQFYQSLPTSTYFLPSVM